MKIAIIHLSDIHIRDLEDPIFERETAILGAIRQESPGIKECVLVVAGDVTFSGKKEQFDDAELLFDAVRKGLRRNFPEITLHEIHVPGNHDCDFARNSNLRALVIKDVLEKQGLMEDDSESADACTKVQDEYFDFARKRMGESRTRHGNSRLYWNKIISIYDRTFLFHCFNTAWMSELKEQQGRLAPIPGDVFDQQGDVNISVFHHPYNWFQSDIARSFRREVESASDLILTGHEHDPYISQTKGPAGQLAVAIEGGVLQDDNGSESSFNILTVDLDSMSYDVATYLWNKDHFERSLGLDAVPLTREERGPSKDFDFTNEFYKELSSVGAHFRHPNKPSLTLGDIYVPCSLDISSTKRKAGGIIAMNSSDLLSTENSWLIVGDDRSGKTALLRNLCSDCRKSGKIPLLISGNELRKVTTEKNVQEATDKAITHCYGRGKLTAFKQLENEAKILLIDDLDSSLLNRAHLNLLFETLGYRFEKIIATCALYYPFQQEFQQSQEGNPLYRFHVGKILPFSHRLRGELIQRWLAIGKHSTEINDEYFEKVGKTEEFIKLLLGRSLLPRYPNYILTLLQFYEGVKTDTTVSGSFGYYYRRLIDTSIDELFKKEVPGSRDTTPDALKSFLSLVALKMYEVKATTLSRSTINEVFVEHQSRYGRIHPEVVLPLLASAELLSKNEDGDFSFVFDYVNFYFTALYLSENLHQERYSLQVRQIISKMASRLHVDAYSSTIVFLVYLTKDEQTLQMIVNSAKLIFSEFKPCDIASDVKLINELVAGPGSVHLINSSVSDHVERARDIVDEEEKAELATRFDYSEDDPDSEIEDVLKLSVSFRTLQVLGQILKNSPGSLDVQLKEATARECFLLGLRTLSFLNRLMTDNLDEFRSLYGKYLKSALKVSDQTSVIQLTDSFIFGYANLCSFGIVKRTSNAIGSEHLEETYEQVGDLDAPIAVGLINVAMRLEHFKAFPRTEITQLTTLIRKSDNWLAFNVLRNLTAEHFVLVSRSRELRSQFCNLLDINENPMFLTQASKA